MSDERFEQDEKQNEDVEAHKRHSNMRNVEAKDDPGTDSEDVEAHRRHSSMRNVEAKDEAGSDDSDDVEAHRRQA
ncbi:MAG: hypothetical protein QOK34_123 [Gaiellaceae bacterium]|jgi:hypothetical protein|nr:hypothetical protein [Gaiellaceae bacterium]MDX6435289.1 hypothetical protein [Gaiellaceae bacterium]